MTAATSTLRLGVLGAANIARAFIKGIQPSAHVKVTAVASRDLAKAKAFANELDVPRAFGSYDEILKDPDIDAIYIPLPNSMHAQWAIRAVEAGKHVLCEKPLCLTTADAKAMFDAARRHKVHLVEGYPYLANPQTRKMLEILESGTIGNPQLIRTSFGLTFADASNIRLNPELGGGALLDAGSYAVSLACVVAKQRPTRAYASATRFNNGLERTLVATLEFGGGPLAQVSCSFATGYHRHALIACDNGVVESNFANHSPPGGTAHVLLRKGIEFTAPYETIEVPGANGFLAEAESFRDLLINGPESWTGTTPQQSIDITATIEAIAASARLDGVGVDVARP